MNPKSKTRDPNIESVLSIRNKYKHFDSGSEFLKPRNIHIGRLSVDSYSLLYYFYSADGSNRPIIVQYVRNLRLFLLELLCLSDSKKSILKIIFSYVSDFFKHIEQKNAASIFMSKLIPITHDSRRTENLVLVQKCLHFQKKEAIRFLIF